MNQVGLKSKIQMDSKWWDVATIKLFLSREVITVQGFTISR